MINDYLDVENAEGMPNLADSTVALDFLLTAKTGVQNLAMALTEVTSPEVRTALIRQLQNAIDLHGEISELMMRKEWFHPFDLSHQAKVDVKSANMALQIAGLQLFPGNTSRLGTFATPFN
jgi:similar to spore coat protein